MSTLVFAPLCIAARAQAFNLSTVAQFIQYTSDRRPAHCRTKAAQFRDGEDVTGRKGFDRHSHHFTLNPWRGEKLPHSFLELPIGVDEHAETILVPGSRSWLPDSHLWLERSSAS